MKTIRYILGLLFLTGLIASPAFALILTTVDSPGERVTVDYDDLSSLQITVKPTNEYLPFTIEINDLLAGNYTLEIPEEHLEDLICAPTSFEASNGEDVTVYCIAKPTEETITVKLKRVYVSGNTTSTSTKEFTIIIKNQVIWYKVYSGGVEAGKSISNGVYTIEHKPKEFVSYITVRKGDAVVWTGLMFPGQEENVTDDLSIKFLGALDNVTYIQIYSTINTPFTEVGAGEVQYQIVTPVCRKEGDWLVLRNVNATVYYVNGEVKNVNAGVDIVKIPVDSITKVICGPILEFKAEVPSTTTEEEERPRFTTVPKYKYYVGENVVIQATAPFDISCTNGYSISGIKSFSMVFDEPTTCTVKLGDSVTTFKVLERPKQTTQQTSQLPTIQYNQDAARRILILLAIVGLLYYAYKRGYLDTLFKRKKKEKIEEIPEEKREIEYTVKSTLEGEK